MPSPDNSSTLGLASQERGWARKSKKCHLILLHLVQASKTDGTGRVGRSYDKKGQLQLCVQMGADWTFHHLKETEGLVS